MNMATFHKIKLSAREISDLTKIQDNFVAEKTAIEKKLKDQFATFWKDVRAEHDLKDEPFHVMDNSIWVIRDATKEEQEAFVKMTGYKL